MPYTAHGHWYGEPSNGDRGTPPVQVARCGGPHACTQCAREALVERPAMTPGPLPVAIRIGNREHQVGVVDFGRTDLTPDVYAAPIAASEVDPLHVARLLEAVAASIREHCTRQEG